MKILFRRSFILLIAVLSLLSFSVSSYADSYYVHDPMKNPKAAVDIIVDPNAVYGYAPNPDSKRMGVFAEYDWSDEAFVAEMRQEREEYHHSLEELYQMKADMQAEGKTIEEIARAISTRRNEIRMEAYKDDPEGLEKLKESNIATFGNENGGTPDFFYQKYGSWETVIEKAFSTNAGADAVLGLYDKYYDTYFIDEDTGGDDDATQPPTESESDAPAVSDESQSPTQENTTAPILTDETEQPFTEDENNAFDGIIDDEQDLPEDDVEAIEETDATQATEPTAPQQEKPSAVVVDRSGKSPRTGDDSIIVLLLLATVTAAAGICIAALKKNKG